MSLYKEWSEMVVDYVKNKGEQAFWEEYGSVEKRIYTGILGKHTQVIKGTIKEFADQFETTKLFFMGFLDGLNDSLLQQLDLEEITEDTEVELKIDLEKLYFNMLDAKADYLYELSQWDSIFSKEKRKEIQRAWRDSKRIVNENKIGRNDPCPCGSGKKYKKCCGKNK